MRKIGIMMSLLVFLCVAVQATPGHIVYINGHAMMSLRAFSHHFDAVVGYDLGRQAITVTRGERTVYLIPYSTTAWIDDTQTTLNNPVVIIDDATYVPVRFMCHAFGMDCAWSANRLQAFILVDAVNSVRIEFDWDNAWGQRAHVWRQNFDYHNYQNFQQPRPNGGKPHSHAGAPAQQHPGQPNYAQPVGNAGQPRPNPNNSRPGNNLNGINNQRPGNAGQPNHAQPAAGNPGQGHGTEPRQPSAPRQPAVQRQPTAPRQPDVQRQPTTPRQPAVQRQPTAPRQPNDNKDDHKGK